MKILDPPLLMFLVHVLLDLGWLTLGSACLGFWARAAGMYLPCFDEQAQILETPNRFTFYSVKATCIKTTAIKLSIFQLRLQVQVQFIMAKIDGSARIRSPNLSRSGGTRGGGGMGGQMPPPQLEALPPPPPLAPPPSQNGIFFFFYFFFFFFTFFFFFFFLLMS